MKLGPFDTKTYVVGDCRDLMKQLPEGCIDCVVTSPPYYGLRDYGIESTIWGGRPDCAHRWGAELSVHKGGPHGNGVMLEGGRSVVEAQAGTKDVRAGQFCQDCGAWLGQLGLEPDFRLYIRHVVDIFEDIRRVLKPEGTAWLNLGDSFATGAGSVGECPGGGRQDDRWRGGRGDRLANGRGDQPADARKKTRSTRDGSHAGKHTAMAAMGPMTQPNRMPQPGLKPKDMMMIPHRVAIALQEAGWWVRSDIVWHKPNPMPESVTDRPTKAHEYLFLLTKSDSYHYDHKAILEPFADDRMGRDGSRSISVRNRGGRQDGFTKPNGIDPSKNGGRNKRSVWTIATEPTPDAHFATMPTALARLCVAAGCPFSGVVLDPFGGSGTVGRVAEDLGREWLLFDASSEYEPIAKRRTAQMGLLARCAP